ncbi:hypothetical protein J3U22_03120 [Gilliamella sp. B2865]|uniref:hypothetical protein n=1 Tax=Gilliamella sp. B2865 TaxID=2817984 RepID=UPI00226ACA12|nr:hypothetical protein [Gilliamella sp. B2865]MCX8678587.1 hypothetical protein [Gilliamella sp. B2865]
MKSNDVSVFVNNTIRRYDEALEFVKECPAAFRIVCFWRADNTPMPRNMNALLKVNFALYFFMIGFNSRAPNLPLLDIWLASFGTEIEPMINYYLSDEVVDQSTSESENKSPTKH